MATSTEVVTVSRWEEYAYGVAAGIGKVVTGHPFDTIKGRVQSGIFTSSTEALRVTLATEGPRALFQGILPPCVSVGFVSGTLFFCNGRIREWLQPDVSKPLTYAQMAIAGGGAGAITAIFLTPLDHMKIWQQVERRSAEASLQNSKRKKKILTPSTPTPPEKVVRQYTIRYMLRTAEQIGPAQLYRGFAATLLREIGTFGIFFPCNEYLKNFFIEARRMEPFRYTKPDERDRPPPKPLPLHLRVLAAGTSGVLCWLPCYPIDVIKSKQQLQGHPMIGSGEAVPAGQGRSMRTTAIRVMREEGPRGFTRGIGPCLLRAFPTYTAQFTLFDFLMSRRRGAVVGGKP